MRNSPPALVAMLLFILLKPVVSQTPTSSPSLTTGQCINDYHPGSVGGGNPCTSNSLDFLGIVGFTTTNPYDECNCDGHASGAPSPPCTSPTLAPGEISCINERGQFENGTVFGFGACRGIDDYVEISITGRLDVKNAVVSISGSFFFDLDILCT